MDFAFSRFSLFPKSTVKNAISSIEPFLPAPPPWGVETAAAGRGVHLTHDVHDHGSGSSRLFSNRYIALHIKSPGRNSFPPLPHSGSCSFAELLCLPNKPRQRSIHPSITATPPSLPRCLSDPFSLAHPHSALPSDCIHRLMPRFALEGEKEEGEGVELSPRARERASRCAPRCRPVCSRGTIPPPPPPIRRFCAGSTE